jgi:hypothetical protein
MAPSCIASAPQSMTSSKWSKTGNKSFRGSKHDFFRKKGLKYKKGEKQGRYVCVVRRYCICIHTKSCIHASSMLFVQVQSSFFFLDLYMRLHDVRALLYYCTTLSSQTCTSNLASTARQRVVSMQAEAAQRT